MDTIRDIIVNVIKKLSENEPELIARVQSVWEKIVQDKKITQTKISDLQNDQLIVNVDSSTRSYQLNLMKSKILKEIQKEVPEINKIYFKVGSIK